MDRDAGHIAAFWARAWKDNNFSGHAGIPVVSISALDGALWDALGKSSSLPLYRILGGARPPGSRRALQRQLSRIHALVFEIYNETIEFEDGEALVPERPGFGFMFNLDYVASLER